MGTPRQPDRVKLIAGLLAATHAHLERARSALGERFGDVDLFSEPVRWIVSSYYEAEMGAEIWRQFVSFATPVSPEILAAVKLETNDLELRWRDGSLRRVNLDPGYVDMSKLVLASTKDAAQRIYLGRGIYAEATLCYESGSFRPYPHTYPDYASAEAIGFFNRVRRHWKDERAAEGEARVAPSCTALRR